MKLKYVLTGCAIFLFGLSLAVYAACPANVTVSNSSHAAFVVLSATPANVHGHLWIFGAGNPLVGAGIDSGSTGTAALDSASCTTFPTSNMFFSGCFPDYAIVTDWNDSTFDGCAAGGMRLVVDIADNTGNVALLTRTSSGTGDWSNLDLVPTQTAFAIPKPTVTGSATHTGNFDGTGTWTVGIGWTALTLAQANGGYGTGDAPPTPVVTGYKVYVYTGTAAPTNLDPTSPGWALVTTGGTVATYSTATATVTFPDTPKTNSQYLALTLTYDSGYESFYTGQPLWIVAPTASGLFTSVSASVQRKQVTANWTTNVESGVVAYDVVYSNKKNGPFQVVPGTTTAPTGNGSSYSKTFPRPRGEKVFLKVKATMTSGVDEYSNLVAVGGGAATK